MLAERKDPGSVFSFGTQETLFQIKERGMGQMVTDREDALGLTSLTEAPARPSRGRRSAEDRHWLAEGRETGVQGVPKHWLDSASLLLPVSPHLSVEAFWARWFQHQACEIPVSTHPDRA